MKKYGEVANTVNVNVSNVELEVGIDKTDDSVQAVETTGAVQDGSSTLTPQFAVINAASGATTIVSSVANRKIRVLQYTCVADATCNATFRSNTTPITGTFPIAQNGGLAVPYCPLGLFETAVGEALTVNITSAADLDGHLVYITVE